MIVASYPKGLPAPLSQPQILLAVFSPSQKWKLEPLKAHHELFTALIPHDSSLPKPAMAFPRLGHCCKEGERRLATKGEPQEKSKTHSAFARFRDSPVNSRRSRGALRNQAAVEVL